MRQCIQGAQIYYMAQYAKKIKKKNKCMDAFASIGTWNFPTRKLLHPTLSRTHKLRLLQEQMKWILTVTLCAKLELKTGLVSGSFTFQNSS